jgi:hypothetical protein
MTISGDPANPILHERNVDLSIYSDADLETMRIMSKGKCAHACRVGTPRCGRKPSGSDQPRMTNSCRLSALPSRFSLHGSLGRLQPAGMRRQRSFNSARERLKVRTRGHDGLRASAAFGVYIVVC